MSPEIADREDQWRGWMLAARSGDANAYKNLLNDLTKYLRPVARRGAQRANLSHADAEDIVQDTLLAIHTKRHTWDDTQGVGPWVRAIARYKLIDAIRRRTGRKNVPLEDFADFIAAPESEPEIPVRDVIKMAGTLPGKQKLVVLAMFVDGMNTAEAAQKFDMTEGAVRVTLHRALSSLSKRFGDQS